LSRRPFSQEFSSETVKKRRYYQSITSGRNLFI